jgi:hypothetical protein
MADIANEHNGARTAPAPAVTDPWVQAPGAVRRPPTTQGTPAVDLRAGTTAALVLPDVPDAHEVAMRLAAGAGALLTVMMWTAVLPPAGNPFMDDHLTYAAVLVVLALLGAGNTLGLGRRWAAMPLVQRTVARHPASHR